MQPKVAIIGANGFVGRHIVELLVRQGRPVLGVVRSDEGARVVHERGGIPFRVQDLHESETRSLVPALEGCAGLVYTASVSAAAGASDRTDPSGLANVLGACRAAGVPKFVFLSGLGIAHYGMNSHCTNPYFLAKMAGEVALFRSDLGVAVFRPSYIFGTGDEFLSPLIRRVASESVIEIPGSGDYRLQPISVADTARAILGAIDAREHSSPRVIDLVGPDVLSYRALILKIASLVGRRVEIRERPVEEAEAQARSTGYFGLRAHDLACLLCDEISDPASVAALLGEPLETVDAMLKRTIDGVLASGTGE
ncbi:MAG TPA: NAD(P)H-binding protein [Vicinamibacteria bacterium]|nr:NAD(P)H-binding protein [Vicinamibacteria bacterium]